jgi:hypothetical protein
MKCVITINLPNQIETEGQTREDILTESLLSLVTWCDKNEVNRSSINGGTHMLKDTTGEITGSFEFVE